MKLIPAIDIKDGQCVRLHQGDFDAVTRYDREPGAVARDFAKQGFDYLHVVDLDGAREGRLVNRSTIRSICNASDMQVQLGGGIRDETALRNWFDAGIRRCVIGSVAVSTPALADAWIGRFTADRIVLALDVRLDEAGIPCVSTDGWTKTSTKTLWDCIDHYLAIGAKHVLCTDVSRDGALSGPNTPLYAEILRRYPGLKLQASGGVRGIDDVRCIASTGASGVITGRAMLDGLITAEEMRTFRQSE